MSSRGEGAQGMTVEVECRGPFDLSLSLRAMRSFVPAAGERLGDGSRSSAEQTAVLLAPMAPHRRLAAFYLLVASRLL